MTAILLLAGCSGLIARGPAPRLVTGNSIFSSSRPTVLPSTLLVAADNAGVSVKELEARRLASLQSYQTTLLVLQREKEAVLKGETNKAKQAKLRKELDDIAISLRDADAKIATSSAATSAGAGVGGLVPGVGAVAALGFLARSAAMSSVKEREAKQKAAAKKAAQAKSLPIGAVAAAAAAAAAAVVVYRRPPSRLARCPHPACKQSI